MSHPLAAGLVDVWIPHETSCGLITGSDSETRSVGITQVTTEGLGYRLTSVPRRYSKTIFNDQSVAWLVIAHRDSSGNRNASLFKKDGSVIGVQEWSGDVRAIMWTPGAAANISYGNASIMRNKICAFAGVVSPAESGIMFNGGEFKAFTPTTPTITATTNALGIGGDAKGTEIGIQWTTLAAFAWQGDKLPTSAELRDLSMNPWQLLSDDVDEGEFSIEQIRRLYMNQGNYTETPPMPDARPLVMLPDGSIQERILNEGEILILDQDYLRTVK